MQVHQSRVSELVAKKLEMKHNSESCCGATLAEESKTLDLEPAGDAPLQLRFLKTGLVKHVCEYELLDFDRALEETGIKSVDNTQRGIQILLSKIVSKLRLAGNLKRSSKGPVFVAFMGYSEFKTLPFAYWTEIIPYCFDCWEHNYERWKAFFLRHRIRLAFFSARQSAQYFACAVPAMNSVWLPEATDPFQYEPKRKLRERDIDVLELGRRNNRFHSKITEAMILRKRVHLFEKREGQIIFADKVALTDGLGRTKISVCFPGSQTHTEWSGATETVTHRYFESMASKCIILGHCPSELSDLFGYNPVVEAEAGKEVEQIEYVLSYLDCHQDLVERNYERLIQVGTWPSRIPVIVDAVKQLTQDLFPSQV